MNITYYASHDRITNPGAFAIRLKELHTLLPDLCTYIQNILIHPFMPPNKKQKISKKRFSDLQLCYVEQMLEKIVELDDKPLNISRAPGKKLVGTCRDYATFLCAVLREHEVPARVRYGFSRYFASNFLTDHVLCEYWSQMENRWIMADAQLDPLQQQYYHIGFDITDIPQTQFVLAGAAWIQYRNGQLDPVDVGLDVVLKPRGLSFIISGLLRDLAALNKLELLTSDEWGLSMKEQLSDNEIALLDTVAKITTKLEIDQEELSALFANPALHYDINPK